MIINRLRTLSKKPYHIFFILNVVFFSQLSYAQSLTQRYIDYRENLNALTPKILKEAINGYLYAKESNKTGSKSILTIVDFNQPSFKRRMWVIDTQSGDVLLSMHVAQGKNTGKVFAKHFSNRPGSDESSLGVFTTTYKYSGEHGESMRIDGLEKGINNNARQRAVVIHPAWYVTPAFITRYGYAGRSWGCFAFNPKRSPKFLKAINGKTVLFAYASPEKNDPNVDHALSSAGEKIYQRIENNINDSGSKPANTTNFFDTLKTDIEKV